MSDEADHSLDLLIRTPADTSGAEKATAALQGVKDQAKGTVSAHEEAGKAAEKHGFHLHALHKIFHSLNEILPGTGALLQAVFSPMGALISVVVLALHQFMEKVKETREELQRMEEDAGKPTTNRLQAMRQATVDAATGMASYRQAMEEAARGERSLKVITDEMITTMRERFTAMQSLGEAEKHTKLAQLEEEHAAGLESDRTYNKKRLEIEAEYQRKKRELEEQAQQKEISMRSAQVESAKRELPGLDKAAQDARLRAVMAREDLNAEATLEQREERKKAAEEARKRFEGKHPEWMKEIQMAGESGSNADLAAIFRKEGWLTDRDHPVFGAFETWKRLRNQERSATAAFIDAPRRLARLSVGAQSADAAAELAQKRSVDRQDFITNQSRDIELMVGRAAAAHAAGQQLSAEEKKALGFEEESALFKGGGVGATVAGGAAALSRFRTGKPLDFTSAADVNQAKALAAMLRLVGGLPAAEPGHAEPFDRTGTTLAGQVGRMEQRAQTDALVHGKALDSTTTATYRALEQYLAGLHGQQSQMLAMILRAVGNQEAQHRIIDDIERRLREQQLRQRNGLNP